MHDLLISEVADYELRREVLRIGATRSLPHLDELGRELSYLLVTTATWRSAAKLWAVLRRGGVVTAPGEAIDADVLIAVQAIAVSARGRHVKRPALRTDGPRDALEGRAGSVKSLTS